MIPREPDWELWHSFLAILREGSLSGAARALGVAHPTVRRHLDELETARGSALFVRSASGLVPTDDALDLREPAEAMEAAAAYLARTASTGSGGVVSGTVRVTASEVMGAEVLPSILAALKEEHPGLAIELRLDDAVENVLRRDADVAVRMLRPIQPDLVARRIGNVPVGFYAHERWLARFGMPTRFEDLIGSSALIGEDRNNTLIKALAAKGLTATRGAFGVRSDSHLAQLAALRAGLGVGLCQIPLAARSPALRRILPGLLHVLEVWLVSHPSLRGTARVRVTLDALARGLERYAGDSAISLPAPP